MATYTREELRRRTLSRIGVLDVAMSMTAEDAVFADDHIQDTLEELYDEGLIPFDLDADAIPARYMVALSYLCALPMIPDYGAQSLEGTLAEGARRGIRTLRRLKAHPYMGAPQQSVYY